MRWIMHSSLPRAEVERVQRKSSELERCQPTYTKNEKMIYPLLLNAVIMGRLSLGSHQPSLYPVRHCPLVRTHYRLRAGTCHHCLVMMRTFSLMGIPLDRKMKRVSPRNCTSRQWGPGSANDLPPSQTQSKRNVTAHLGRLLRPNDFKLPRRP
jgi:hypothetical protein